MHQSQETVVQRRARSLAALADLGFERVEAPPTTETVRLDDGWRVTRSVFAMGTVVTATVADDSEMRASSAAGRAIERMYDGIATLNRYDDASALAVLNAERRLRDAPEELLFLLRRARALHLLSAGAFDVTVAPVIDVLLEHREAGHRGLPDTTALAEAARRIDANGVFVEGRDLRLREGVRVTLDGIAKGLIVDMMADALESQAPQGFLINAGGDIRVGGSRGGGVPWRVGVRDPVDAREEIDVLELGAGAVATSGSYEIYFDSDHGRHHIVDARGDSPGACRSVTVRGPNAMIVDALATAAFVAGPSRGPALVESVPGCTCLLVDTEGRRLASDNWRSAWRRPGDS